MNEPINATSYYSKLVGTTFEGRPNVIAEMKPDTLLRFRREPENGYDKRAVAVDALIGKKWMAIGYIARDKNKELSEVLTEGRKASIKLNEVTGGDLNKKGERKNFGVNVYITYEKKKHVKRSETAFLEKDIFGNEIFYDDVAHKYTNALGEVYLSGSAFASQSEREFPKEYISNAMAKKAGLGKEGAKSIVDMWDLKADASAAYGTAVHAAIELYGKYKQLADGIGKETHIHDSPDLNRAVTTFFDKHPKVDHIKYECLVVDHKTKRAGRIDQLEYDDDGVWVGDIKTNVDIAKSIDKFWLQLSFYAAILMANGLKVKGLKVYHYTGTGWDTLEHEVIAID